jgi:hypothetical protein
VLYIRFYQFSCQACGKQYKTSLSPFPLGTGRRRCKNCSTVFNDGSREWAELSGMQKFEYIFPTTVLGYFGAFILVLSAAYWIGTDAREKLFLVEMMILLMGFPWIPYFMIRAKEIRASRERHERHKVFGDTDEFILST